MKLYKNKTIFSIIIIIIVILLIIMSVLCLFISEKKSIKITNSESIQKYNNCLIFGGTPVRYETEEMVVEKCVRAETTEDILKIDN